MGAGNRKWLSLPRVDSTNGVEIFLHVLTSGVWHLDAVDVPAGIVYLP
jgi:hypothetical protein